MDDLYGIAAKDPGRWDEENSNSPSNKDCISKITRGFAVPVKRYEFGSCLHNTNHASFINAGELSFKSKQFAMQIQDTSEQQTAKVQLRSGSVDEYGKEYLVGLSGRKEKTKIDIVASSLFKFCVKREKSKIANLEFLLWLLESNRINRWEVCTKFLDMVEARIGSLMENDKEKMIDMANHLCNWNVVLSQRARSITESHSEPRSEPKGQNEQPEESNSEEPGDENLYTCLSLSSISREYDLICLLDNEQFHREHDLDEMVRRMEEIDCPQAQLPILLNWALRHRSSMGCTLAARIIKRWDLHPSCTLTSLLVFIVNAQPPSTEKEGRRSSGAMKGETGGMRFLRALSRLFVALSYEELISYNDLLKVYEANKDYFDGRSAGFSLGELLSILPIIDPTKRWAMENEEKGSRKSELWTRAIALLNKLFCVSAQSWYAPMSGEEEREARAIVEGVKCLSSRDSHDLATRVGDAMLGAWRDVGRGKRKEGETTRLSVPSRSSLLILCQLMDSSVDSSLLPRFVNQCLPYLLAIAQLTPHLAVYSASVALFLTARCFQSHLTLAAMGIWPMMRKRMAEFVQSLCPLHWQARRLAKLFEVELPQDICSMKHGCVGSENGEEEQKVISVLEALLKSEEWTEIRLTTVADLVGDLSAALGTQSIRDWWRRRLVTENTTGPRVEPMLRLLVLSVYRGVVDAEEIVEWTMEGMRKDDSSIVTASVSILNSLLVGGANRDEEELLVEGSIGGEVVGRAIGEIARMASQPPASSLRNRCSTMLNRLMKRQYPKRVMREEMEEVWLRRGESKEEAGAEAYHQLTRKCTSTGWSGLELEGGRGLRAVSVFEADAVRREMQWILVKEHSTAEKKDPSTIDSLVASILDALAIQMHSACLAHLLLTELRWAMMEDPEVPPVYSDIYRNFAASMISGFIGMLKEPARLPSSSSLLIPTVLFAWIDADEKIKDHLREEIRAFLSRWRGETQHLLMVARLAISLSEGMSPQWIEPFYELIRLRLITPDRNSGVFVDILQMMERIELEGGRKEKEKKDMEGKKGEDKGNEEKKEDGEGEGKADGTGERSEVMGMYLDGRPVEEILHFLKRHQQFERIPSYEVVKGTEKKRGGLKISSSQKIKSEEWMDARGKGLIEKWRVLYQADTISVGRGRWFMLESRKRKIMEELFEVKE